MHPVSGYNRSQPFPRLAIRSFAARCLSMNSNSRQGACLEKITPSHLSSFRQSPCLKVEHYSELNEPTRTRCTDGTEVRRSENPVAIAPHRIVEEIERLRVKFHAEAVFNGNLIARSNPWVQYTLEPICKVFAPGDGSPLA